MRSGWTLVELMVVLGIVAILAAVAFPGYGLVMQKVRRSDAINSLLALQLDEAAWRNKDWDYATLEELNRPAALSFDGYYQLQLPTRSEAAFLALAVPLDSGPQSDDSCGTFAIDQDGPVFSEGYADAACWGR